ncbi:MAG: hypothetical protein CMK65_01195 [Pseudoalteromonas sp.]|uniref:DUF2304 domain-containing protein n=1 Tax=Pseudoalteromonas sp. TaxID=53249 RepID=UPI000C8BE739|nr:DUF2304 domain-containing protein [Pseudoalteromonas sp.]MAD02230.1 hypothetical protein [Pseudoalteromonas sp.]|tara:strand:+ start:90245 stop:90604 length:360 start_codon:yes stop_codon:yes gene_type:complete
MQPYQIFSASVALIFFIVVFILIRRDSILIGAAFRWFVIALMTLILGFYPNLADLIAQYIGISYAPILPITITCLLLLIKALLADIQISKLKLRQNRITQKLAILELEMKDLQEKTEDK